MKIREIIGIDHQAGGEYLASFAHMNFWELYSKCAADYSDFNYPALTHLSPFEQEELAECIQQVIDDVYQYYLEFRLDPTDYPKTQEAIEDILNWLQI